MSNVWHLYPYVSIVVMALERQKIGFLRGHKTLWKPQLLLPQGGTQSSDKWDTKYPASTQIKHLTGEQKSSFTLSQSLKLLVLHSAPKPFYPYPVSFKVLAGFSPLPRGDLNPTFLPRVCPGCVIWISKILILGEWNTHTSGTHSWSYSWDPAGSSPSVQNH